MRVGILQSNTYAYNVLFIIMPAVRDNVWAIYGIINESVSVNTAGESREGVLSDVTHK